MRSPVLGGHGNRESDGPGSPLQPEEHGIMSSAFDSPSDELLFRYVANECTATERQEVEQWRSRDAAHAKRVEDIRRIWHASPALPPLSIDRTWTRIRGATEKPAARGAVWHAEDEPRRRPLHPASMLRGSRRGLQAIAWAAALVVIVAGAALVRARLGPVPAPHAAPVALVYTTGPAETRHIQLGDGSRVMLAPMSRLRIPGDFGHRDRTLTLDGQGFFEILHNPPLPFRVRAHGAITEDVGTRFDVRAYPEDSAVVVIVVDGAVTLDRAHGDGAMRGTEGVVVHRGERARLGDADSVATVDQVSLRSVGWTDGHLSFVDAPLGEVARAIGRWYDLDVRVSDTTLARRMITADFPAQSAEETVATLATAVHADVERNGRVLTIRAKR
jgi:transmembrane sensor